MRLSRVFYGVALCLIATTVVVSLSRSETKKENRVAKATVLSNARLSTTSQRPNAPAPSLRAQSARVAEPLNPADFLALDHGKNKTRFGEHTLITVSETDFATLTADDFSDFQVVYTEPDWNSYTNLTGVMSELEAYVQSGGVVVINIAGNIGDGNGIAPGGVNYSRTFTHENEFIPIPDHPYITGEGYDGAALVSSDFNSWGSTDHGTLSNLPEHAEIILENEHGPSMAEYSFGRGSVIVTTLTVGWAGPDSPHRNLIHYAFSLVNQDYKFAIANGRYSNVTPITLVGSFGDSLAITRVTAQIREEDPVDASIDTEERTFSLSGVSLLEGPNRIIASGFAADNSLVATDTATLILDTVSPEVIIETPADGSELSLISGSLVVSGSVIDDNPKLLTLSVNDQLEQFTSDETFTFNVSVESGSVTLTATATDQAGNTGSHSVTVNVTVLSPDLVDAAGFLYDIQTSDGAINDGGNTTPEINTSDAYDGWGYFKVDGNLYESGVSDDDDDGGASVQLGEGPTEPSFEEDGRELVLPIATIGDLEVFRKIYVPASGPGFARFINAVHNPTEEPITVDLSFDGDLGSDGNTRLKGTSSGGETVQAGVDTWFVTDDSDDEGNDPALAHVFDGEGGADQADDVFFEEGNDSPVITWQSVAIAPGETKIYLFFEVQRDETTQALEAAEYMASLPPELFQGMSQEEIQAVQNFPQSSNSGGSVVQLGIPYSSSTDPPFQTPGFGVAGDTLWIPVFLKNITGRPAGGLQFTVTLTQSDKASPVGFALASSLDQLGFDGQFNSLPVDNEPDHIETRVVVFSDGATDEDGDPVGIPTGEAYLGSVGYALNETAPLGDTYQLLLSGVLVGDQNSDPIGVAARDYANLQVGIQGDLSLDGQINIFDVIRLVRILVGKSSAGSPGSTGWLVADASVDGALDIVDVVVLVNRILGLPIFPEAKAIAGSPVTIGLGEAITLSDGRSAIPVTLDSDRLLAGAQLSLRYNPALITVDAPQLTDRSTGMALDSHSSDGVLNIVVYSLTPGRGLQPGHGAVLHLPVTLINGTADAASLTLTTATVATATATLAPVTLGQTSVKPSAVPGAFALWPASPNPFNPTTQIAYEVPQPAHVTIAVYNLLGQEVVRLVDGLQAAGRYNVVWNGRNALGASVASGVYLYRMTTDAGFVESRRMTLLK